MTNSSLFVFKLRRNITLEGDVALAKMELAAFLPNKLEAVNSLQELSSSFPALANLGQFGALDAYSRKSGQQGFLTYAPLPLLSELLRCLSFVQYIYC